VRESVTDSEVKIAIDGHDVATEVKSLWDWLRYEPELRGRLRVGHAPAPEGTMGLPVELAVLCTSAVGVPLARALSTWLVQRRSDVVITVTGQDGQKVSVSAQRVAEPEKLLRQVLEQRASSELAGED
jgi:hypothetical protein